MGRGLGGSLLHRRSRSLLGRVVPVPAKLNLDLAPLAAVAALEFATPDMVTWGRSREELAELGSGLGRVRQGVPNGEYPAVSACGFAAFVAHGGGTPLRGQGSAGGPRLKLRDHSSNSRRQNNNGAG